MIARSLHTHQRVVIKVIRNVGTDPDDEELRILRFLNDEPRLGCFGYQLQLLRQALKVSHIPRNGYRTDKFPMPGCGIPA